MQQTIRIGTRASKLALWQANKVKKQLDELGHKSVIVPIKSTGDTVLEKPLYEFGITGIFTKNLDIALLNQQIDIAVHSLKDVPTTLPQGIVQVAVLKRANPNDILILKTNEEFFGQRHGIIATGSLRRRAQWLNRYPTHQVVNLRGNVNTRLQKLENSDWNGAIFAAAGLQRMGIARRGSIDLSWMIPAPAQGAIVVASLKSNEYLNRVCQGLNHRETEICTTIERDFLNYLEGGCTAPIGALASINPETEQIRFRGILLNKEGTKKIEIDKTVPLEKHRYIAKDCAEYIINKGAKKLMQDRDQIKKEFAVYSTKKLSNGQKRLIDSSLSVQDSDFITIRFNRIPPKILKDDIENVIITSKNAVEAIVNSYPADKLNFKNIYCVGIRTKRLIESKIAKVTHCAKNAEKLATYLSSNLNKGDKVSYFCSNIRLDTIPEILTQNGIVLDETLAYKTIFSPTKVAEGTNGVLFYSPSTIESYLIMNAADKIAFCIGESTAKVARQHFQTVKVAKMPTVESVIKSVNSCYVKTEL